MLKKVITCIFIFLACFCILYGSNRPLFSNYAEEFEVYSKRGSIGKIENQNFYKMVFNLQKRGEACVINSNASVKDVIKDFDAVVVLEESVDGKNIVYAYSDKIKYRETVGGKTVNIQIVETNNVIKVGSPLIYGSF